VIDFALRIQGEGAALAENKRKHCASQNMFHRAAKTKHYTNIRKMMAIETSSRALRCKRSNGQGLSCCGSRLGNW